jgi:hypothetical protein
VAVHDRIPPKEESSRWVRRLAYDLAWLGWGWTRAPRPLRMLVWSLTCLALMALTALAAAVGLPVPQLRDLLDSLSRIRLTDALSP